MLRFMRVVDFLERAKMFVHLLRKMTRAYVMLDSCARAFLPRLPTSMENFVGGEETIK